MKRSIYIWLASMLITTLALAAGRITNSDVKSINEIKAAVLTITGNLTNGSQCIAAPSALTNLKVGHYAYDSSNPSYIPAGTTIVGLPGTCSAGQIKLSAAAAGTVTGDTLTFGGQPSQLINDTKVYVTNSGVLEQLSASIADGSLFRASAILTTKGDTLGYSTTAARVPVGGDGTVLTADSTQALGIKWASSAGLPAGIILPYGGNTPPAGFLLADGSAVSRTTYAALFANISTNFGSGDGSTTFNLPDMRWVSIRGRGPATSVLGQGTAAGNFAAFPSHGLRTGVQVRMSSGTLSGLTTGTDYWVIVVDSNDLAFATTRANALSNTRISLSGTNSATIVESMDPDASTRVALQPGGNTGGNVGSYQDDAIQGHGHNLASGTGGSAYGNPNGYQNSANGPGVGDPVTTAGNGTVRYTSETRSKNVYVNYIISY